MTKPNTSPASSIPTRGGEITPWLLPTWTKWSTPPTLAELKAGPELTHRADRAPLDRPKVGRLMRPRLGRAAKRRLTAKGGA